MEWMNRLSLKARLLVIVFFSISICSFIAISGFLYFNKQEFYRGITEKSRAIHLRLDAAAHYVATQDGLGPVIDRMKAKYKSPEEMTKEDKEIVLKQVPIVAAMKIGSKDADKDNYEFRIFSDEPRNKDNSATKEELEIFMKFKADSALKDLVVNNGETLTVFRPVRLEKEKGCFKCHGDPQTSPWNNGKDILGYKMENWEEGKLHGVFAIKTDFNKLKLASSNHDFIPPEGILILGIILGAVIALIMATLMIKKPIQGLSAITNDLNTSGTQVSSAATQIATSAEELSQATTQQAASLQETSASIEEISSMVSNNTSNAQEASLISEKSLGSTQRGKEVVDHMIKAIGDINISNAGIADQISTTNKEIENIVKIINEIGDKTKVINDIVFQTKLLSFNASVEAARAGEQGKGFAVVAEEVGNLAAMSGAAAQEITSMLESSIRSVEEIVKRSKDSVGKLIIEGKDKVDSGTKIAHECEEVFNDILSNISNVSRMVSEISSASQEQSQGIREITKAVAQLDQVTHQNTSTASQSSSAAGNLSSQASQLNALVQSLVRTIEGDK